MKKQNSNTENQTQQEQEVENLMNEIILNTEKQLNRMKEAKKENDLSSFLWGQFALWENYYKLREEANKEKVTK